jgi:RNA polymerase sigma-70 factor, ECF subfamily
MNETADEVLVEQFVDTGDSRHADELVGRHLGKVRAMIYAMVLNNADADDLAQATFSKAFAALPRFRREARFSTWLYRIAMNTVRDFLRRRARNPVDARDDIPDVPARSASPDDSLMNREEDALVASALAALSPPLRAAITLTAIQGLSVTEAAHIEGCLTATLYWRVHHARKLLKKSLERSRA